MEKGEEHVNYAADLQGNYTGLDYSLDHQHPQLTKSRAGENSGENNIGMVDYMFNNPPQQQQQQQQLPSGYGTTSSLDKINFSDVMQFADFGPKLALNQNKIPQEEDPVYYLKFPVLQTPPLSSNGNEFDGRNEEQEEETRVSENNSMGIGFLGGNFQKNPTVETKNRRKRPRSVKTSEEVESQRMTHIAVERNRRKQMNEHLRVLRGLMPGSYVQRGDQASIIGGAIEFVRELEQLLQCLESQKRRRLYGNNEPPSSMPNQQPQPPFFPPIPLPNDQTAKIGDYDTGLLEETAESKSCLADVEVKVLGFDALIKILSRRRPGQLIKAIEALEELQFNILHTNITTIEQTVLYSFNVKVTSELRFTADDIASSVQQIFSFIHASTTI
ncbi:hypothetical protein ACHQM5_027855 [Ranunculus cassubicifolius]